MALYAEENGDLQRPDQEGDEVAFEGEKKDSSGAQGRWNHMPHRGLKPPACFDIWLATFHIVENLYDTPFPTEPQNDLRPAQPERNEDIRIRRAEGELVQDLAQEFGISEQRVSQIIRGRRA